MKSLVFLLNLSAPLIALEITDWGLRRDPRLVEVSFSDHCLDDPQSFHSFVTLYISEWERGGVHEIEAGTDNKRYVWSHPDHGARQKAERCLHLLSSTSQPTDLPADPRRLVTVRWADWWIERQFPTDRVPAEIHQMLLIMGFRDKDFKNLAFIQ